MPKRGLGDAAINEIAIMADKTSDSMLGAVLNCASLDFSGRVKGKLLSFSALVDELMTNSLIMPPIEFVDFLLDKTGLIDMYKNDNSDEAKDRLSNLEELSNAAKAYFDDNPDATLRDYLVNIALVSDPEENGDIFGFDSGRVGLMTLHSAKGLEFPTVFIIGMEEGLFPLARAMDDKQELEEERRLCYVGMTRAMKQLYLTHADLRIQYGETRANPPSRFLDEIPASYVESLIPKPKRERRVEQRRDFFEDDDWDDDFAFSGFSQRSENRFSSAQKDSFSSGVWGNTQKNTSVNLGTLNYSKPQKSGNNVSWRVAMKVRHKRFGFGRIINVQGGNTDKVMLTVAFENNGVKNLIASQANLEIIGD